MKKKSKFEAEAERKQKKNSPQLTFLGPTLELPSKIKTKSTALSAQGFFLGL